jgi:hypothetical protein
MLDTSASGRGGVFWGSCVSERHCVLRLSALAFLQVASRWVRVAAFVFLGLAVGVARYLA